MLVSLSVLSQLEPPFTEKFMRFVNFHITDFNQTGDIARPLIEINDQELINEFELKTKDRVYAESY
jgi:hypothetical protein